VQSEAIAKEHQGQYRASGKSKPHQRPIRESCRQVLAWPAVSA